MKIRPRSFTAAAIAVVILVLLLLSLTACASGQPASSDARSGVPYDGTTLRHELSNGQQVSCEWTAFRDGGGLLCDWQKFSSQAESEAASS